MSDFFTKKQRKYWCESCKIFIEYTKQCIDIHNKSKNHLRMLNSDAVYKNMKRQIIRHNSNNYIDEDQKIFLNNKTSREENYELREENTRVIPNSMLEEIKKESIKQNIKKISMNPEWTEHFDPQTGLNFYYNHITGLSQWNNPYETIKNKGSIQPESEHEPEFQLELENKESKTCIKENPKQLKQGLIGKWEIVEKSESFFEKNKIKGGNKDYMPGIISEEKYHKLEEGLSDSDKDDDSLENQENLTKEDFIKLNKKLRKIEYNTNTSLVEEKLSYPNIVESENLDIKSEPGPVSFTFNTKKKNIKKVSSIFTEI
jgi:hypothetical protein